MKLRVIVVDRTRFSFLKQGESFYLDRLKRYAPCEWAEVKPAGIKKGRAEKEILSLEGEAISKKLRPGDRIIALDRTGKPFDSVGLAGWIQQIGLGDHPLTFVIGGPLGLSQNILDKAHLVLSLSSLTFTHEMCRMILLEQLYRAFTILNHGKYHK